MADPIQRVNYFKNQFLHVEDFTTEQAYHLAMRRRHNKALHTFGIAEGLELTFTPNATGITIRSGVAIDSEGREIVLVADEPLELADVEGGREVFVTVAYDEKPAREQNETGVRGNTRVEEKPRIERLLTRPAEGARIVLGRVVRGGTNGTQVTSVDQTVRTGGAGAKEGPVVLGSNDPAVPPDDYVTMRWAGAKRAELTGSLSIAKLSAATPDGNLTVQGALGVAGTVGIGTTQPVGVPLEVRGESRVGRLSFVDGAGAVFPNGWIGMANNIDGASRWLHIGGITDAGARRLALFGDRIYVGGRVGIGSVNPGAPLEIVAGPGVPGLSLRRGWGDWLQLWKTDVNPNTAWVVHTPQPPNSSLTIGFFDGAAMQWGRLTLDPSGRLFTANGAVLGNTFAGDVGHGVAWGGLIHSNVVGNRDWYAILQSNDGRTTLINKRSGGGSINLQVDNIVRVAMDDRGTLAIDMQGTNAGASIHPSQGAAGTALVFGALNSGEGIGSKRTGGGNVYGLDFYTLHTPRMSITNGGNVGIGITTPASKLDVAGNIQFSDTLSSPGRMHITGEELLYLLHKNGVIVGREWGGNGNVTIQGRLRVESGADILGGLNAPGKVWYVADQFVNRLGETLEQGDVVVLGGGPTNLFAGDGIVPILEVDLTDQPFDMRVCGIVADVQGELTSADEGSEDFTSTANGDEGAEALAARLFSADENETRDRTRIEPGQIGTFVTLGAFSYCKADAEYGAIEIGDLLTTSPTRGHAQKVPDEEQARGAILGKALAPLAKGKGKIPVLVTLH